MSATQVSALLRQSMLCPDGREIQGKGNKKAATNKLIQKYEDTNS